MLGVDEPYSHEQRHVCDINTLNVIYISACSPAPGVAALFTKCTCNGNILTWINGAKYASYLKPRRRKVKIRWWVFIHFTNYLFTVRISRKISTQTALISKEYPIDFE